MSNLPARRASHDEIVASDEYAALRDQVIARVGGARERAARAINSELVLLYWGIGRAILERQQRSAWGEDVVGLLAQDLRARADLGDE